MRRITDREAGGLAEGKDQNDRVAALVQEFLPLNRRKVQGDPPLSVLELQRWSELTELLAFELGDSTPLGGDDRSLRVPTHLKVRYGDGMGELRNLSEGGLFIECERPLAHGTPIQLELEPSDGGKPISLSGTVVWSRELATLDGPTGFGVRFEDLEADEYELLMLLIEDELSHAASE